jgi:hypothetical protein
MPSSLIPAIHDHLLTHGPSTPEEIHQALLEQTVTSAKTASGVRNALASYQLAFRMPDERWDLTTRVLTGVVLTVRPRSRLRDGILWIHKDLEPFDGLLSEGTIPLLSGGSAHLGGGGEIRTLLGPDGWLPAIAPGDLIGLRWTGYALDVFTVDQTVPTDDTAVALAREVLRQHAAGLPTTYRAKPQFGGIFISALREVPDLFSQPLPPLSELVPFDDREFADSSVWEAHSDGRRLTLHLPQRVYDELDRRATLLGEALPDHAAVLLGAAVDRARPLLGRVHEDERYDEPDWTRDVLQPLRWTS